MYTSRLKIISLIQLVRAIQRTNLEPSFGIKKQKRVTRTLKKRKMKIKKKKMKTKKRRIIIKKKESLGHKKQSI